MDCRCPCYPATMAKKRNWLSLKIPLIFGKTRHYGKATRWERIPQLNGLIIRLTLGGAAPEFPLGAATATRNPGQKGLVRRSGVHQRIEGSSGTSIGASP